MRGGIRDERHLARIRDPVELHPAYGLVRGVVHVGGPGIELPGRLLGRVAEVLALGARRDIDLAEAVRLLDRLLRPLARIDIVGRLLPAEEVHRHHAELQRRTALQEEHLVVLGDFEQLAEVLLRLLRDRDELLAAVAHLHHRHARTVPVEHLGGGLLEHLLRQDRRPGAEIEHPRRRPTAHSPARSPRPLPSRRRARRPRAWCLRRGRSGARLASSAPSRGSASRACV